MPDTIIDPGSSTATATLATLIRRGRLLVGWSQQELATRAETSQTMVWRLETNRCGGRLDLPVAHRVLHALGVRVSLQLDDHHLDDRVRQKDAVHAPLNGYATRRVEQHGWLTATEVMIGDDHPRGWIDLLAYRAADRSLLVGETKADLPDMGGLQRSLAFYQREAVTAARLLGWDPVRVVALVVALDSQAMVRRLDENRDLVDRAFPGSVDAMLRWLADPKAPAPRGWTLGLADPRSRRAAWLRSSTRFARRRTPAYRDYAEAAAWLRGDVGRSTTQR